MQHAILYCTGCGPRALCCTQSIILIILCISLSNQHRNMHKSNTIRGVNFNVQYKCMLPIPWLKQFVPGHSRAYKRKEGMKLLGTIMLVIIIIIHR